MASVVLLLGGECTGKTALAHMLATRATSCPVSIVDEVLREFVVRHERAPTRHEQEGLWREQTLRLDKAIADAPPEGLVVCDPAPLMTAVYSLQYFEDDSLLIPALQATDDSDFLVWCAPDIPWEPDGVQRDGPHARQVTDDLIAEHVVPHVDHARLIRVTGDLDDRLEQTLAHLP